MKAIFIKKTKYRALFIVPPVLCWTISMVFIYIDILKGNIIGDFVYNTNLISGAVAILSVTIITILDHRYFVKNRLNSNN